MVLEMVYSGCEEWVQLIKIITLGESHQLHVFFGRDEGPVSQALVSCLSSQNLVHQNPGFFICLHICLRWPCLTFELLILIFSVFYFSVSREACHGYSPPPVITLEVSKTSLHLR